MRLSVKEAEKLGIKIPKNKYRAKKTTVDGISFPSQKEANYYSELKLEMKAGHIIGFCRQPEFILQDGTGLVLKYKPDFIKWLRNGSSVVVEVKGKKTEAYIIREKLFRKQFPKIKFEVV